jgi:comEA protein
LVFGLGSEVVRRIRGRDVAYPLLVTEKTVEGRAWKRMADSISALNEAARNAPVRINTATAAEFESLDGIGKVLAARIVAYRNEHGPFSSVDELDNVSGIGPKRLAAIRPRCVVDSL